MKLKWKVSDEPVGRYRSFERRGWPSAYWSSGESAAHIICKDSYVPRDVKIGNHSALKVMLADHSVKPWTWRKARMECKTLKEAKEFVEHLLNNVYPHFKPKEIENEAD